MVEGGDCHLRIYVKRVHFTPANTGLQDKDYPELGSTWKAAQIKLILWYITKKACQFAGETNAAGLNSVDVQLLFQQSPSPAIAQDPILQSGASCSWALQTAISLMDSAGLIMTCEDAELVHTRIKECLLHWQANRSACISAGIRRWSFRPKHHYLEHIAEQIKRTKLNHRKLACFQDESYLGQIKAVAVRCHSASALLRIFQRLILNMGLRFQDSRKAGRNESPNADELVPSLL